MYNTDCHSLLKRKRLKFSCLKGHNLDFVRLTTALVEAAKNFLNLWAAIILENNLQVR